MLSFPRRLQLKEIDGTPRFLRQPIDELDTATTSIQKIANQTFTLDDILLSERSGRALDIHLTFVPGEGSTLSLAVRQGESEQTVIEYTQSN